MPLLKLMPALYSLPTRSGVIVGGRIREYTRNAAVDGDGCMYTYWDDTAETGQASKGAIRTEVLMNTQVLFGNPNNRDVQSQPYIILIPPSDRPAS